MSQEIFHTIVVTVLNRMGVISRITGLFSARGYNIQNIIAAPTENSDVYRVHIGVVGTVEKIEQVVKQLNKLVDTIQVTEISHRDNFVVREFVMVKIAAGKNRAEISTLVNLFRAKVIDVAAEDICIDLSGPAKKIERFIELLKPYGIKELVRTGPVAITV